MSGMTHGARTQPRDPVVVAVLLIAIGVGALVLQAVPDVGAWVVLLIGLALMAAFVATRDYGALVPGSIMTGLGVGIALAATNDVSGEASGGVIVLGLGLGFLSIWLISGVMHLERHHPWPLIPGGILSVVGLALLVGGASVDLLRFWPVVLIALGAIVIVRVALDTRQR
jgi:hypothetical protein